MNSSLWKYNNTSTARIILLSAGTTILARAIGTIAMQKWKNPNNTTPADEDEDGMPILPANAVKYSQLPKQRSVFTASTTPRGLLNRHNTKVGTWGVIRMMKGTLEYKIAPRENTTRKLPDGEEENDAVAYPTRFVLSASPSSNERGTGIIAPQQYHKVVPGKDAEFVVEFHRLPATGAVDETRE
uniref:TehB/YeaR-like domain-containing protein n=1 Tax=Pseudo-nitzschia australis TaxID=44445 RepID=A0A7S4AIJ7_9STRA|mmetsp:Transcript_19810/g.42976  ORF Transcript_19810/g.42976 Transcript_19810/m.42976 type:complete len:185 (-) Transcript_19810:213-767(-)|eukprot:CAMPEP_0168185838 /NCGR_PEP_ID=MMETSP0139_2-20121125/14074_1 /TAXON_ID=44445 /ORGANISM="Pseudo-nitzschia australis, Strain 10249 10 AB" /LENGTH=184 /DNA_ID=CAMNT_0008107729 /DNA_START=162 /DNA_END=716 /DNA_ORIENTATION=+